MQRRDGSRCGARIMQSLVVAARDMEFASMQCTVNWNEFGLSRAVEDSYVNPVAIDAKIGRAHHLVLFATAFD